MSMTTLSAQEEGRAFVEAAEVTAQLHGTYFKYEDEDEVEREDIFQRSPNSSLGTNDNTEARTTAAQDPLAFVIQRKKLAMKATKKLFPSLSKGMVARSNKLNKGHLCLKWHSATKAQRTQHLVKRIDPGYEKIEEADLLNTLDWLVAPGEFAAQHKLPPKYKDDNHFKQDWFMGIYMQLMTNHCPEWVDNEPTCATNLASMEFPIFARDTKDMEASAAGPDIELAQSWESPTRSHPLKGLDNILFQQSDAKTTQEESSTWADGKTQQEESSGNTSWNSPPFDAVASSTTSPATTTTDQLRPVEGVVVTAEKKKKKEEHD
eukprot:jgi/Psemu1/9630/gm1.9630_g